MSNSVQPQHALTFGRFNVCTIAHLYIFKGIASRFENITIGVIDQNAISQPPEPVRTEFKRFYELADKQHIKTVLSLNERRRLLELSLTDSGLDKKTTLINIPRPEHYVAIFNKAFPSNSYQLVFQQPVGGYDTEFDDLRNKLFPKIFQREVYHLLTPPLLHTTAIKEKIAYSESDWSEFLTPSAYQYFLTINGPNRVK